MARKVILDVDPGIDDAVAIIMALFDPRLEVVAITATGGNVSAQQTTRNVQAIIEQLDPPRWPRIGSASEPRGGSRANSAHLFGADGLANTNFEVAELHNRHRSERLIADEVRAAPEQVTIITMGPLTNLARAFIREPDLPNIVGHLIVMGGAVAAPGNITPAAEFNMFGDPEAARTVLCAPVTKTLIPLDVTEQCLFDFDLLNQLPPVESRAGGLLKKVLPHMYHTHRQELGLEGIYLHDPIALMYATDPELFETEEMACDVEVAGELTSGATVFDRRTNPEWRKNMEVATSVDFADLSDRLVRSLQNAGKQS